MSNLEDVLAYRGPLRTIGVVGMGYVGIPSAVLFADSPAFAYVYGFQRDSPSSGHKITLLNRGESPLRGEEPELGDLLRKVVVAGKFLCTSDFSHIRECDAITLAIQTPFRDPHDLIPDFTPLEEALRHVGRNLTAGALVVLESTVTPGTTCGIARQILEEESGLAAGEDFALAHAPERVMVGRLVRNIHEHDRIIGGIDSVSTKRAIELYHPILTKGKVIQMTATAAEVEKTAENALRDLQIAAANELALYCEVIGVNFYEVREGVASLREEGVTRAILFPGAGVGGHCLTKDTYHLERGVRLGSRPVDYPENHESLFTLARAINDFMPRHTWHLTEEALYRAGTPPSSARVAILGWAFIANSDDIRNPPSEPFRELAIGAGAVVRVHDPFVESYPGVPIEKNLDNVLAHADAIAILTGHRVYRSLDPERVHQLCDKSHPVIVDGRNIVDPDTFIRAGFIYKGIGRGDKNIHPLVD
ncbi:MAG: nucleotide sugar dehydrogenase [Methanomicrobiales archaeon]|nr:nucleotide sugar dehydrogenase [Methanomicrobiales archaeon]